jgi:hypothetical protein
MTTAGWYPDPGTSAFLRSWPDLDAQHMAGEENQD